MGKAGAIIAIVAGVLGTLAAFFTLFVGGIGSAFSASDAGKVVTLGWGGVTFSFLAIVYGGVALSRPRPAGLGLILSSLAGMVVGGTLVAAFMALALVGGIMAVWPRPATAGQEHGGRRWPGMLTAGIAPIGFAAYFASQLLGPIPGTGQAPVAAPTPESYLPVGATAKGEQFEVTVRQFALLPMLQTRFSVKEAEPGSLFAVLQVKVRCIDRESRHYHAGDLFGAVSGNEVKFDNEEYVFGVDSPSGQLNPMTEASGMVIFKIPAGAASSPLTWQPGRGFGNVRFLLNPPPTLATAAAAHPAPPQTPGATDPSTDVTGTYSSPNGSSLSIVAKADGSYHFELTALSAPGNDGAVNTGEASGDLAIDGDAAVFKDGDCTLQFHFNRQSQGIQIEQQGVCDFGLGVAATGHYVRTASARPAS